MIQGRLQKSYLLKGEQKETQSNQFILIIQHNFRASKLRRKETLVRRNGMSVFERD